MTRLAPLVPCFALVFISCIHTHDLGYESSQTTPERFSTWVTGEDVTVTLRDSTEIEGRMLSVTPDSLYLRPESKDSAIQLATRNVRSVLRGASAVGPILGTLGGGGIGSLVGYAAGRGSRGSGAGIGEGIGILFIGSAGLLVGAVVGANITPGREFLIPAEGIPRGPVDTLESPGGAGAVVTVEVDRLLEETPTSVTIRWYERTTVLPKSHIAIEKRAYAVLIRAPRSLLYNADNTPKYLEKSK